ncbi:uncharacterized protein LOC144173170 [Haemaphysalis longicornis]
MIVMGFPVMYLHHMRNLAIMEATGLAARRLSSLALASATFSCLGMAVVALNPMSHVRRDGQWVWPVFVPHLTGALLFFVSAFVHMLVQTRLMYALNSRLGVPTGCVPAKTLLSAVASVSVVFMVSYAPMGEDIHVDRAYRDTLYDPIVNLRRMTLFETTTVESANQSLFKHYARNYPPSASFSIAAEWVFIFCFLLYFASYAGDLRDCTFILDIYILDRVTTQPLPLQQQSVPADNPIPTDGPIPLSIPTPVPAQQPEIHP